MAATEADRDPSALCSEFLDFSAKDTASVSGSRSLQPRGRCAACPGVWPISGRCCPRWSAIRGCFHANANANPKAQHLCVHMSVSNAD